jgi:hypothetical protein
MRESYQQTEAANVGVQERADALAKMMRGEGAPQGGGAGGAIPLPPEMRNVPDGSKGKGKDGRIYIKRGNLLIPAQ